MKPIKSLLALACLACAAAMAADIPVGSKFDGRIQLATYNEGDVVVVRAVAGLSARIVFAPDEVVEDIASGFTQGWEFSDQKNILYLKPKSVQVGKGTDGALMTPEPGKWDTNLMVKTNKRMYDFDLQLLPNSSKERGDQRVAYRVEFRYPADEAAKAREAEEKAAAKNKVEQVAPPRNWAYSMDTGKGSEGIAPSMAYDDGRFTYLKFPHNRDFPAVFAVAADGSEAQVNRHVEDDTLVIHAVVRQLNLRLGNAVVGVYNEDYDADGLPPTKGTTIPGVIRVLVGGEK